CCKEIGYQHLSLPFLDDTNRPDKSSAAHFGAIHTAYRLAVLLYPCAAARVWSQLPGWPCRSTRSQRLRGTHGSDYLHHARYSDTGWSCLRSVGGGATFVPYRRQILHGLLGHALRRRRLRAVWHRGTDRLVPSRGLPARTHGDLLDPVRAVWR